MKVIITGNMGYVGPVLVRYLRERYPAVELVGIDTAWFAHCLTTPDAMPERLLDRQIFADVRDLDASVFAGADAVVHLAAVSNDPMGNRFEAPTIAINFDGTVRVAQLARAAGVPHFVFASSCSVYGSAEGGPRKEADELNPLTAYARSKISSEKRLAEVCGNSMVTTCLRFATACGMSDRLRLDLVLNDFVASALSTGGITVLSDGTPWRPLIDVQDMARAIDWAIGRGAQSGGQFLAVNTGSDTWNYQVRDLAEAVVRDLGGVNLSINANAPPDKRSYRVDFSLFRGLAPQHQPQVSLSQSIGRLVGGLKAIAFSDPDFRNSTLVRLRVLDRHLTAQRLDADLRWTDGA